jgi:tRNA1Val (adenine37-N6)-methyltransferase
MLKKDYLPNHKNIVIYQEDTLFKMTSDSSFLGESFTLNDNQTFLDIGCNTGVLMLYAYLKSSKSLLHGIDINKKAIQICELNMQENNITNYQLFNMDVKDFNGFKYDVIVCNPPFYDINKTYKSKINQEARQDISLSLDDLLSKVKDLLNENGTFYLLFPNERKAELKEKCQNKLNIIDINENRNTVFIATIKLYTINNEKN